MSKDILHNKAGQIASFFKEKLNYPTTFLLHNSQELFPRYLTRIELISMKPPKLGLKIVLHILMNNNK